MFLQYLVVIKDTIKVNYKFLNESFKTWFINLTKLLGALVKQKGITNQLYNPNFILKEFFHSSPVFILIWW